MSKKTAESQSVALCIISSVKFMISISNQVQELLKTLQSINYLDLLDWKPSKDITNAVADLVCYRDIKNS